MRCARQGDLAAGAVFEGLDGPLMTILRTKRALHRMRAEATVPDRL